MSVQVPDIESLDLNAVASSSVELICLNDSQLLVTDTVSQFLVSDDYPEVTHVILPFDTL